MKREIKFRGICARTGNMMYGYLSNKNVINTENGRIKVTAESVGQFTGLQDKNGIDIYEGDIVVSFKKAYEDKPSTNMVQFVRGCFMLICIGKNDIPLFNYMPENLEIIGNIHEVK